MPHSRRTPSLFPSSQSHTFRVFCCSGQENQPRFTEACWILRLYIASLFCENLNYDALPQYLLFSAKNVELNANIFKSRSQKAAPLKVSTQEEIGSFLQDVPSQIPGYIPERVLGLFKTQTDAGRKFTSSLVSFCTLSSQAS